ncbi:hypothetical protein [Marinobacter arenosus]|uniref:hypothetical protein n=1 Tax=Marinobacter arenosus TaxID=2856822 RepID=UPI001C4C6D67|nr:hypothetical protein [Marinobacter arenosus]MBW0148803.1 hypothetical protein [Marinobacter arenosus]
MSDATIDEIRNGIILRTQSRTALYQYVDPGLADEIETLFIGEVANAIATLYVGYKLGDEIEDVGSAIARTIDAVGDIARSIAKVIDKLADIIDAIDKAIEAISRHIDSAFMNQHISDMKSRSLLLQDIIVRLDSLPPESSDPRVAQLLARLQLNTDELYTAIIRYTNQEPIGPSPATFIGCAPAIAMWVQTYTLLERYKKAEDRVPPWDLASQKEIFRFVNDFFDDYIAENARVKLELENDYLLPTLGTVVEFNGRKFVASDISRQSSYPDNERYYSLFSKDSFNYFDVFSTKYRGSIGGNPIPDLTWGPLTENNYDKFPEPQVVLEALRWQQEALPKVQLRNRFLHETNSFHLQKEEALKALSPQDDW